MKRSSPVRGNQLPQQPLLDGPPYMDLASTSLPFPRLLWSRWSLGWLAAMARNVRSFLLVPGMSQYQRVSGPFVAACGHLSPEDVFRPQLHLQVGFIADPHCLVHTRVFKNNMAECWIPADWMPYSPDLNPLDFSAWSVLQKVRARPRSVWLPCAGNHQGVEPDIASLHPLDLHYFHRPSEVIEAKKWHLHWIDGSPTDQHNHHPFLGYQSFNKRCRPIHWKKKNKFSPWLTTCSYID
jgi:hypothetical protein